MNKITLKRVVRNDALTQGVLLHNESAICVTLENPWLDNARNISCIPAGRYKVQKFSGRKYKDVWQILDVPNRSYILFHQGNSTEHTDGCVLVGRSFNAQTIKHSRDALEHLRLVLPDEFELEIINA